MKTLINGCEIAYSESGSGDQVIIFVHGNSHSSSTFFKQFNAPELSKYRLLAIDLPGHGDSGHDVRGEAYSLIAYADTLKQFVEKLNLSNALFVGHSLGGHIVLEGIEELNASGVLIFDTPPASRPMAPEKMFLPHPAGALLFAPKIDREQAKLFASACFSPDYQAPEELIQDILATNGRARELLGASVANMIHHDEVNIVEHMLVPLAILCGEKDQLINNRYFDTLDAPTLWQDRVQLIENAGHDVHWQAPAEFNRLLCAFADEVFQLSSSYVIRPFLAQEHSTHSSL